MCCIGWFRLCLVWAYVFFAEAAGIYDTEVILPRTDSLSDIDTRLSQVHRSVSAQEHRQRTFQGDRPSGSDVPDECVNGHHQSREADAAGRPCHNPDTHVFLDTIKPYLCEASLAASNFKKSYAHYKAHKSLPDKTACFWEFSDTLELKMVGRHAVDNNVYYSVSKIVIDPRKPGVISLISRWNRPRRIRWCSLTSFAQSMPRNLCTFTVKVMTFPIGFCVTTGTSGRSF